MAKKISTILDCDMYLILFATVNCVFELASFFSVANILFAVSGVITALNYVLETVRNALARYALCCVNNCVASLCNFMLRRVFACW